MVKGKPIGKGATADVYDWTDNTIIKIFNDYEPDEAIGREINNTKALVDCNFKFPRFIEQLNCEGRRAAVYEKVVGTSMMRQMETSPFSFRKHAKKLAHLHYLVHRNHVDGIREQKAYFKERILWSKDLSDDKKEKLYKLVNSMPEGDSLCHSDFHPDNILLSKNGDYIIDWADCCNGNPCADVARTILTLTTAEVPEDISKLKRLVIKLIRNWFSTIYTKEYLKISGKTINQINEWKVAVAAYRLCAARKIEKIALLKIINEYLGDKNEI